MTTLQSGDQDKVAERVANYDDAFAVALAARYVLVTQRLQNALAAAQRAREELDSKVAMVCVWQDQASLLEELYSITTAGKIMPGSSDSKKEG